MVECAISRLNSNGGEDFQLPTVPHPPAQSKANRSGKCAQPTAAKQGWCKAKKLKSAKGHPPTKLFFVFHCSYSTHKHNLEFPDFFGDCLHLHWLLRF
jgi:hypothetical protein